ncbi:probable serine/threonine-protein kinase DDB_G0283337 [Chironomus tepperi]|uniref:probable serine/threonine-protein kinase DDB_G0283337 n=1 Tax=Chironomus tepperi TaxID=113505 RepID=UPI00391F93EE
MKKWFHLRVALALLGAIVIHLILWPIYCCAGSPIRNLHFANNKMNLSAVDDSHHHQTNNNSNNSSYEISTNNNVAHSYKNYLHVSQSMDENSNESIMDKNNIIDNRNNEKEHNNNSRITSSIYDIFLINSEQKMKETSRTLMRNDRSANQYHLNGKHKKLNGTKRVKNINNSNNRVKPSTLDRNERSANLSHITGSARKIQLYIKNRFLQLMPDGTVNGTTDDSSDYTILQRTTVNVGQIKIQGVATCLFLCMDNCGITYGSVEFTDDCIFNESMEQHHYNTYSSTLHSNGKRTFYLGLNRHGQPRKIQIPSSRQLGKLSTYTKSLTQTVAQERVDKLITRLYGANHLRHGLKQLCDTGRVLQDIKLKGVKNKSKCNGSAKNNNNNNKKKKNNNNNNSNKKRKCRDNEGDGDHCTKMNNNMNVDDPTKNHNSPNISTNNANNNNNNNNSNNLGNNKKKTSVTNNQPKKCNNNDDCNNNNNRKLTKKKLTKKTGQTKNNLHSNGKQNKKKVAKNVTTTLKPDEEYVDQDIIDSLIVSEEEEEEYGEINSSALVGDSMNAIDEHDQNEYSL